MSDGNKDNTLLNHSNMFHWDRNRGEPPAHPEEGAGGAM